MLYRVEKSHLFQGKEIKIDIPLRLLRGSTWPGIKFTQGRTGSVTVNAIGDLIYERPVVVQAAMNPVQVLQPLAGFGCRKHRAFFLGRFVNWHNWLGCKLTLVIVECHSGSAVQCWIRICRPRKVTFEAAGTRILSGIDRNRGWMTLHNNRNRSVLLTCKHVTSWVEITDCSTDVFPCSCWHRHLSRHKPKANENQ